MASVVRPFDVNPDKEAKFLEALADCGRIMESCRRADWNYEAMHAQRKSNLVFAERVQDALRTFSETLEAEAVRRGRDGWMEPVFGSMGPGAGSGKIGEVRKYSDRMLEITLKKTNPEYRDSVKVDATISGGVLVVERAASSVKDWEERHADSARDVSDDSDASAVRPEHPEP